MIVWHAARLSVDTDNQRKDNVGRVEIRWNSADELSLAAYRVILGIIKMPTRFTTRHTIFWPFLRRFECFVILGKTIVRCFDDFGKISGHFFFFWKFQWGWNVNVESAGWLKSLAFEFLCPGLGKNIPFLCFYKKNEILYKLHRWFQKFSWNIIRNCNCNILVHTINKLV